MKEENKSKKNLRLGLVAFISILMFITGLGIGYEAGYDEAERLNCIVLIGATKAINAQVNILYHAEPFSELEELPVPEWCIDYISDYEEFNK